ncbi:hypothetical protein GCM10010174_24350 [Kutzneria viridogrisea]
MLRRADHAMGRYRSMQFRVGNPDPTGVELMTIRVLGALAAVVVTAGWLAVPAGATRSTVPCDAQGLARALGGASSGASITLAPHCTYRLTEALPVIGVNLTINGNGATISRVAKAPAFRVLHVGQVVATITDLEVSGGLAEPGGSGGGILNDGVLTLDHVVVTGNRAGDGLAGGYGNGGSGGGVFSSARTTLTMTNSTVSGNAAGAGGADGTGQTAPGAGGRGGGIGLELATLTLTGSRVTGNRAGAGGAGRPGPDASHGGGNGASGGDGGGISLLGKGSVSVRDSSVCENTAGAGGKGGDTAGGGAGWGGVAGSGGGLSLGFNSTNVVERSTVCRNTAGRGGDAGAGTPGMRIAAAGGFAGGLNLMPGSTLAVRDSALTGNATGEAGKGDPAEYTNSGGAVLSSGDLTITGGSITGNHSHYGGGAIEQQSPRRSTAAFHINGLRISGNTAGGPGGGIDLSQATNTVNTLRDSEVTGNTAASGGGLELAASNTVDLTGSTIRGNHPDDCAPTTCVSA